MNCSKVDVSLVVCTHNRAAMLREALESLLALETAGAFQYEIVVVDNASSDETAATVQQLQSQSAAVRYIYEAKKGIATARNRGVRESQGDWIAFFDDDQLADPRWLVELVTYARDFGVRAVGGPVQLQLPPGCTRQLHSFVAMLLGESRLGNQPFQYSLRVSPGTGNLMLHRSVFEQVGLFDEAFAVRAEDTDLFCRMWRAGIEAWYVPTALVHHVTPPARLELPYLHRLATFMGGGIAQRERDTHALLPFAMRFLAKALLIPATTFAASCSARLCGRTELALGQNCRLQLAAAYCKTGWNLLRESMFAWLPRTQRTFTTTAKT